MVTTKTQSRPSGTSAPKHDEPPSNTDTASDTGDVGVDTGTAAATPTSVIDRIKGALGNLQAVSERVQHKMQLSGEIRQKLAELSDTATGADEMTGAVQEIASDAALAMYQGRINGDFTADEITEMLGDQFGFVKKGAKASDPNSRVNAGDKNASATPYGRGAEIRKRVVRMVAAAEYAKTGKAEGSARFFADVPQETVATELAAATAENEDERRSVWTVFDRLAKAKRDNAPDGVRVADAFNPKKIAAIVGKLAEKGGAEVIANDTGLIEAYASLFDVLDILGFGAIREMKAKASK